MTDEQARWAIEIARHWALRARSEVDQEDATSRAVLKLVEVEGRYNVEGCSSWEAWAGTVIHNSVRDTFNYFYNTWRGKRVSYDEIEDGTSYQFAAREDHASSVIDARDAMMSVCHDARDEQIVDGLFRGKEQVEVARDMHLVKGSVNDRVAAMRARLARRTAVPA